MPGMAGAVACPQCGAPIPWDLWNQAAVYCPGCLGRMRAYVFPAISAGQTALPAHESEAAEGEASCFFHPLKRAAAPCEQCGRFLCDLCQVDLMGRKWCPACLDNWKKRGKLGGLDSSRPLYDNMALGLAIAPALLIWPTIVTAPISIYVALRYWRSPGSLLPRTRLRYVLALLFSTAQIAGWVWLAAFLLSLRFAHRQ